MRARPRASHLNLLQSGRRRARPARPRRTRKTPNPRRALPLPPRRAESLRWRVPDREDQWRLRLAQRARTKAGPRPRQAACQRCPRPHPPRRFPRGSGPIRRIAPRAARCAGPRRARPLGVTAGSRGQAAEGAPGRSGLASAVDAKRPAAWGCRPGGQPTGRSGRPAGSWRYQATSEREPRLNLGSRS